jgi:hypothetical protein
LKSAIDIFDISQNVEPDLLVGKDGFKCSEKERRAEREKRIIKGESERDREKTQGKRKIGNGRCEES